MCGIAGIYSPNGAGVTEATLRAMTATIVHRGPDDEGMLVDGPAGLAMRRLSIIGVSDGAQPLFNEDRTVAIVMNGEIYNYPELKRELVRNGHTFRTGSDVETAVHRYEERGADFVTDLRGMFAFALYDARTRRLLLGRDRVGKKPLYYALRGRTLLFASEIKALHATGMLAKEIDRSSLRSYLSHGFVPGEQTLFAGVRKLPPGCVLEAGPEGIRVRSYWDFPLPGEAGAAAPPRFEDAAQRVRELLEEAVRIRLMSEVPLGAFLSGGVDSSAIVALMSRGLAAPVETFAVGFADADFDELVHARQAAELYGTNHHEVLVQGCSPDLLFDLNRYHDEPAADPATVPTLCLARFARQRVTVALTGEGGDELFGGYRHYRLYRQLAAIEERVAGVRGMASVLLGLEPYLGRVGPRRLWKGLWITSLSSRDRVRGLVNVFIDPDVDRLLREPLRGAGTDRYDEAEFGRLWDRARDADHIAQAMYVDAKAQMGEQLLMKVDKTTMAASLEARCPFLDQRLIEFVGALPTTMKIGPAGTKLLLRRALRGLVPDALLDRKKHGFEVPVRKWMLGDLAGVVESLLLRRDAPIGGYVDLETVRGLWRRLATANDSQLARQLWTLLNLAVWQELHWGASSERLGARAARPADALRPRHSA
jgi:asparagine synthase (glutamine-hydrolysing)